jgi:hypothetical protein
VFRRSRFALNQRTMTKSGRAGKPAATEPAECSLPQREFLPHPASFVVLPIRFVAGCSTHHERTPKRTSGSKPQSEWTALRTFGASLLCLAFGVGLGFWVCVGLYSG